MRLENQVCSLQPSKKLHELGLNHPSIFVWEYFNDKAYAVKYYPFAVVRDEFNESNLQIYPAYTVAELGEILPDYLYPKSASGHDRPLFMTKVEDVYIVSILNPNQTMYPRFYSKNEADARAEMLIYLIEDGFIKTNDIP
ncbi:MAG TPA: hypothetical protein VJ279_08355 [Hanamia sp.]|jgi:hypothetical protein|nr:hypothetical protein [Hanamia sp.]